MLKRLALIAGCAVVLNASTAGASVVLLDSCGTLANVIANGCTIGDKLFTGVTFDISVGGDIITTADIEVQGITDPDLNFGFGFRLTGLGGEPLVSAGGSLIATLAYTVSVLDPLAFLITDLHLGLDTTGNVLGVVSETATDLQANAIVGALCVDTNNLLCASLGLGNVNDVVFGPVESLSVVKLLSLTSVCDPLIGPCGSVESVDQIVTQQRVPEPATVMLLGTAAAALAIRRRRATPGHRVDASASAADEN